MSSPQENGRTCKLTKYAATGRVTRINPTKNSGMTVGGYLACSLKMWWIWGCLAYRRGADTAGGGVFASCLISISKASARIPWAEPKEPMTTVAWMGFEDAKNGVGISFWVCRVEYLLDSITHKTDQAPMSHGLSRTICTLPLPVSLTLKGKGASRPVSWSFSRTNAWCGRFALPLSFAVRKTVRVSCAPRAIGVVSGFVGPNLCATCQRCLCN